MDFFVCGRAYFRAGNLVLYYLGFDKRGFSFCRWFIRPARTLAIIYRIHDGVNWVSELRREPAVSVVAPMSHTYPHIPLKNRTPTLSLQLLFPFVAKLCAQNTRTELATGGSECCFSGECVDRCSRRLQVPST